MIADRCHVEIEFHVTKMPSYDVPEGYTASTYLRKLCQDGLKRRYPDNWESLSDQLEYELGVIEKMGYVEYFLIVWDFINYAREHGIPVGRDEEVRQARWCLIQQGSQTLIRQSISCCLNDS